MIVCLDHPFPEQQLAENDELDLRNVSAKGRPTVLSRCAATDLRLYNLNRAVLATKMSKVAVRPPLF